jgi:hypothetical protein
LFSIYTSTRIFKESLDKRIIQKKIETLKKIQQEKNSLKRNSLGRKKIMFLLSSKRKRIEKQKKAILMAKLLANQKKIVKAGSNFQDSMEDLWMSIPDSARNLAEGLSKYVSLIPEADNQKTVKIIGRMNDIIKKFLEDYKVKVKKISKKTV